MRYIVVRIWRGKIPLWYILDDKTNKIVSESFAQKRDAEKVCKKINKEIKDHL